MIPFVDLISEHRSIKKELEAAVLAVLESGRFILGQETSAFEREFATYCGAGHGVAVNSGTSALHLALLAADLGPGDEVITTPFTFVATVAAICYVGARPILVDIDPDTFNIDPARIESAITPRTRAILPVHLYGQPADMSSISDIARRHGLLVIEDAAQAHGARFKGARAGSLGDMACFSFYPTKNLGACGEAGMVLTNSPQYAQRLRALRDHGQETKNDHRFKGYNYRMEAFQGSVLRVKLPHLDEWTQRRQERARLYDSLLEGSGVVIPRAASGSEHVYHLYVIRTSRRDALRAHLAKEGIETGVHYPLPVHQQEGFRDIGYPESAFPVAENCARSVLSLPIYPDLTEAQAEDVVKAVRSFAGR